MRIYFQKDGIFKAELKDIEVTKTRSGKPCAILHWVTDTGIRKQWIILGRTTYLGEFLVRFGYRVLDFYTTKGTVRKRKLKNLIGITATIKIEDGFIKDYLPLVER